MENQASSKSVILNYGLYYGIVAILFSVIMYAMNMHLTTTGGMINLIVIGLLLIIFPILSISKFRKNNGGLLSWGQAVKVGIGVVILGTLISIIYNHIFTGLIEPDFYNQVAEIQRQALEDANVSQDVIDSQLETQAAFQGTLLGDAVGILFFAFLGFIVSAIAGAVMKKSEDEQY